MMMQYDVQMRNIREWTERLMQIAVDSLEVNNDKTNLFADMDVHYGTASSAEAVNDIKNILLNFNNLCYMGREKISVKTIQADTYQIETYVNDFTKHLLTFPEENKKEAEKLLQSIVVAYQEIYAEIVRS